MQVQKCLTGSVLVVADTAGRLGRFKKNWNDVNRVSPTSVKLFMAVKDPLGHEHTIANLIVAACNASGAFYFFMFLPVVTLVSALGLCVWWESWCDGSRCITGYFIGPIVVMTVSTP